MRVCPDVLEENVMQAQGNRVALDLGREVEVVEQDAIERNPIRCSRPLDGKVAGLDHGGTRRLHRSGTGAAHLAIETPHFHRSVDPEPWA
jgi:hypothetical protein